MNVNPDIAIFSPVARSGGRWHGRITPLVCNLADAFAAAGRRVELLTDTVNRLFHKPVFLVLSVHNTLTPALNELRRLARALRLAGIRKVYPGANAIVCVSAGVAEDLTRHSKIPAVQLTVIHNPIVTPRLLAAAREYPGHPWLQAGQPPVILGAGRLTRQKDFSPLIRAFPSWRPVPIAGSLLSGKEEKETVWREWCGNWGSASASTYPALFSTPRATWHSRLFVLSSAWEGFGNVLVKTLALVAPCMLTDCRSGPREVLVAGRPVPVDDAMLAILRAPLEPGLLRWGGAECFDLDASVRDYLRILLGRMTKRAP